MDRKLFTTIYKYIGMLSYMIVDKWHYICDSINLKARVIQKLCDLKLSLLDHYKEVVKPAGRGGASHYLNQSGC